MPQYIYQNSKGETREIIQSMNDIHEYFGENGDENDWIRLYTVPTASVDAKLPSTKKEFLEKTAKMRGTVGEMQQMSAEISEKRAQRSVTGEDPIKRSYFDNYKKERKGRKHHLDRKDINKNGVKVSWD